jgi:hypothetical protein
MSKSFFSASRLRDGYRRWLENHHAVFWSVSLLVCLVGYNDVVFRGKTFLPIGYAGAVYEDPPYAAGYHGTVPAASAALDAGAHMWHVHPGSYLERRALSSGELPHWNRHAGLGNPLLSTGQTATLNPLHLLVLIDPDSPLLWDFYFFLLRLLAALFTCYLLYRLGVGVGLSTLGAPFAALNGAFTLFVQRADLGAFALMPAVLYFLVRLRDRPTIPSTLFLSLSLYTCLTSGHPQPAFAVLFLSGGFGLFLLLSAKSWPARARYAAGLVLATAVTVLLSAPYWYPFLQQINLGWSAHPPGVGLQALPARAAIEWLIPGGTLPAWGRDFGTTGFLGAAMGSVAAVAVVASAARVLDWFRIGCCAFLALILLKIVGMPGTEWLGKLPLLERTPFTIYFLGPTLFLLAVLGITALQDLTTVSPLRRGLVLGIAALLLAVAMATYPLYLPSEITSKAPGMFAVRAATYTASVFLVLLACSWICGPRHQGRLGRVALVGLAVLTTLELGVYRKLLSDRGNPMAQPPYVDFLKRARETQGDFRVMGLGMNLMPNLSTVFGLEDVRICDALVSAHYQRFVKELLQPKLLWDWWLTASKKDGFDVANPILDLLNLRYFIGDHTLASAAAPIGPKEQSETERRGFEQFIHLYQPQFGRLFGPTAFTIDNRRRPVLFQHPTARFEALVYFGEAPVLKFDLAVNPGAWRLMKKGITYAIRARRPDEPTYKALFETEVDPARRPEHRRWLHHEVDLSRFKNQWAYLELGSRSEDTSNAWGGWGSIRIEGGVSPAPLSVAYRDEQMGRSAVLENHAAWPRAFLVKRPFLFENEERVLQAIRSIRSHGRPFAAIALPGFPLEEWKSACQTEGCAASGESGSETSLIHYGVNDSEWSARTTAPAIFVLSESIAKGWKVWVDGAEQPLFRVNYLFRGVILRKGKHVVRFAYEPPKWKESLMLCGSGGLLVLFAVGGELALSWRRRRRDRERAKT